jgi:predicted DNA-binding protein YlxM (UPF0122 family)
MFEYYYNLGEDRSIIKTADHFGVSRQTISKCSKELNWTARVHERDLEIYKKLREENNEDIKDTLQSYRKVIKASIANYINNLKSGKIKVESVKDFKALVELELKICGFMDQISEEKLETLSSSDSIIFTFMGRDNNDSEPQ